MVNLRCFVLWRKAFIPKRHPILPPMAATVISVASGMRHKFFRALCLSASIRISPSALTSNRYMTKSFMCEFLSGGDMVRVVAVLLCVLMFFSGCWAAQDPEMVLDVYDIPVSAVRRDVILTLPEGAAEAVMESGSGGSFYLCDGFSVSVSTLPGGDLERSIRDITGFDKSALTILQTTVDNCKRYTCAWSSVGEGTDQVCRAVILNDGYSHHAVTVMCDYEVAGDLSEQMNAVLDSVKLVNTPGIDQVLPGKDRSSDPQQIVDIQS